MLVFPQRLNPPRSTGDNREIPSTTAGLVASSAFFFFDEILSKRRSSAASLTTGHVHGSAARPISLLFALPPPMHNQKSLHHPELHPRASCQLSVPRHSRRPSQLPCTRKMPTTTALETDPSTRTLHNRSCHRLPPVLAPSPPDAVHPPPTPPASLTTGLSSTISLAPATPSSMPSALYRIFFSVPPHCSCRHRHRASSQARAVAATMPIHRSVPCHHRPCRVTAARAVPSFL